MWDVGGFRKTWITPDKLHGAILCFVYVVFTERCIAQTSPDFQLEWRRWWSLLPTCDLPCKKNSCILFVFFFISSFRSHQICIHLHERYVISCSLDSEWEAVGTATDVRVTLCYITTSSAAGLGFILSTLHPRPGRCGVTDGCHIHVTH